MSHSRARAAAVVGVDGFLVEVEAAATSGPPGLHIYGLPDNSITDVRDRVRAAVHNAGLSWPHRHLSVGLLPASLPKYGSRYDLAIAVAVLAADGSVPDAACTDTVFAAELGLDGALRPVTGILPAAQAAAAAGCSTLVVAPGNAAEAAAVPGITVVGADNLGDVVAWLRGGPAPQATETTGGSTPFAMGTSEPPGSWPDLTDLPDLLDEPGLPGLSGLHRALEVAAAGGHHLLLVGRTGAASAGRALMPLLPDLTPAAALEVATVHSVAGLIDPGGPLVTRPPYRNPAPTGSRAAMCGTAGPAARPGEMALAHRGVLHLDAAPDFAAGVLDALRGPLEESEIQVARAGRITRWPARFTLLLTMAPCPCGAARQADCRCSPAVRHRYLARIGGPLLDRIGIKMRLPDPQPDQRPGGIVRPAAPGTTSATVAERVAAARARAARRLTETPWTTNAEVPAAELRRRLRLPQQALPPLDSTVHGGTLSTRSAAHVARLAWTLADLAGRDAPTAADTASAIDLNQAVP